MKAEIIIRRWWKFPARSKLLNEGIFTCTECFKCDANQSVARRIDTRCRVKD